MTQRWSRESGWYPDSVGDADFRWWDGTQWTEAVSDTLWAPEPRDPPPYVARPPQRPGQPVQGQLQGQLQGQTVPGQPSRGQPMPGQPMPGSATLPTGPVPTVVEVEDDRSRFRRPLLIGVASVVAIAGLVAGAFVVVGEQRSDGQSSAASSERDDHTASRARPDATPAPSPSPSPEPSGGAEKVVRPVFSEPGKGWVQGRGFVPHSQVRRYITEKNYSGEDDWGAFIAAGEIPQGVTPADELADTAADVARWYAEVGFASDRDPATEVIREGPTRVGSRPAYEIELKVDYEIEGLRADWDRTTVVVLSLGPGRRPGVFLASVPNTHQELGDAVAKAQSSLRLSEGG